MELFNKLMGVVSQGNVRRGSFAAYLPIGHGDIEEFLKIRGEGNEIQDLSIGVTVADPLAPPAVLDLVVQVAEYDGHAVRLFQRGVEVLLALSIQVAALLPALVSLVHQALSAVGLFSFFHQGRSKRLRGTASIENNDDHDNKNKNPLHLYLHMGLKMVAVSCK